MREKIEKLEKIRVRTERLDPRQMKFADDLRDLSQEALGYCEEKDDGQEIQWLKKAIRASQVLDEGSLGQEVDLENRRLGLAYLKESLDAILIRERNYLD